MVEKLVQREDGTVSRFESSVNSYGRKTGDAVNRSLIKFESSVNSYGRKTC